MRRRKLILFIFSVPVTDDYDWYRPVTGRRYLPICNAHSAFGVGTYYVGVRANNFFNVYNRYKVRVVTQSTGECPAARTMPDIPSGIIFNLHTFFPNLVTCLVAIDFFWLFKTTLPDYNI